METDLIKFNDYEIVPQQNLNDLSGTIDDIGRAIANLSRVATELPPLVKSIQQLLDNPARIITDWLDENPFMKYGLMTGVGLFGVYIASGIVKNGLDIGSRFKKKV